MKNPKENNLDKILEILDISLPDEDDSYIYNYDDEDMLIDMIINPEDYFDQGMPLIVPNDISKDRWSIN